MKLRYDADLPFQRAAIDASTDLFEGQPLADSALSISFSAGPLLQTELGIGNNLALDDDALLANLRRVQERNGIAAVSHLDGRDFAVEMETGTGKTYVFLRTAFALNAAYGFSKYVIVVPSVAIREGVLHSIATMREHFAALYGVPFDAAVYDSRQTGRLRQFATANTLQFLVINIQAFQRDAGDDDAAGGNVIYREQDRLSGHRPIEFLQATHPIVIVDEPQSTISGEASRRAVERLNPLCTLRYSATYDHPNKIYRLGPIEALDQRLVKRIEVASVVEEQNLNDAFVRLLKTDAKKQTAQVEINVGSGGAAAQKKKTVKVRDDLAVVSGNRQEYADGWIVQSITFERGNEHVEFSNGVVVPLGEAAGSLDDEVMKAQVVETVREHLDKELRLRPLGIKVLSLFFIDKVANYRVHHDDGAWSLGKIGQWFEEAFRDLSAKPAYAGLVTDPVEKVHDGYFSKDRKGGYRDTRGDTKDDEGTYELIMRDKERLLSMDEPLRFIFSHSALREGWDNPNVFQICTLNESRSTMRKRQEIGRGLRLPVNQHGERVHDEHVNRLTVIANESYRSFAQALQTEYEEETHVRFGVVEPVAFSGISVSTSEATATLGQDASRAIWTHLRQKGYLDGAGKVLDSFDPRSPDFVLDVPEEYAAIRPQIVDAVNGHLFRNRVVNKRDRARIAVRRNVLLDEGFKALWDHVAQRTRYRVSLDTEELVRRAAERIRNAPPVRPLAIKVEIGQLEVNRAGVEVESVRRTQYTNVDREFVVPDVLAYLQNETDLTRKTLVRILVESGRAEDLKVNPQQFIAMAEKEINRVLRELMIPGIQYERIAGQVWEMQRLERESEEELIRYLDNLYQVRNDKTPFDYIEYQSEVERDFARRLDDDERIRFFVKLPSWFKVDTPLGPYNPDWAFLMEGQSDRLYFVRETKGSIDTDDLRQTEADKIACGRKHFLAIDVNFEVVSSWSTAVQALTAG